MTRWDYLPGWVLCWVQLDRGANVAGPRSSIGAVE